MQDINKQRVLIVLLSVNPPLFEIDGRKIRFLEVVHKSFFYLICIIDPRDDGDMNEKVRAGLS